VGVVRASERIYPVYPAQGGIVVDGNLDEAAWQGAPAAGDFFPYMRREPVQQTRLRMLYDAENLYLAIRVDEARMDKLRVEAEDGGHVWQDDSMEIFLQQALGKPYYQFPVNAIGSRISSGFSSERQYKPELCPALDSWQGVAASQKDHYVIEAAIPLAVLGITPEPDSVFRGNFCRNCLASGSGPYCTWSPISTSFHEVDNFGEFRFRAQAVPVEQARKIERFVNLAYSGAIEAKARRRAKEYRELLAMVGGDLEMDEAEKAIVDDWQQQAEAIERYVQYSQYFTKERAKPGFWEADHAILAGPPCAPIPAFYFPLTMNAAAEEFKERLLLMELLK